MSETNEAATSDATVLVVDDIAANLELLSVWLEDLPGVNLLGATNGAEALEQVERHHPDLILLDVMMPRLSGFEVCRRLKADPATRDIAIIMVTALDESSDVERAAECGADDFISQPVNRIVLLTRVRNLLALRRLRLELDRADPASCRTPGEQQGEQS
ncbi:MAG: response regulator [Planctomycetota bacterium]